MSSLPVSADRAFLYTHWRGCYTLFMKRIGIIGFGIMGEAFATGLARKLPDVSLLAYDVRQDRVHAAAHALPNLAAAGTAGDVFAASEITILCVKPQDFATLAGQVREVSRDHLVISILAGRKISAIADGLATDQVARFMPNIAATKGTALVGVSFHANAGPSFREDALAIAAALGSAMEIPEKLMSAITGVSGSGLAFVLQFVHAMAQGGVAVGFDYRSALAIAIADLEGAASLLKDGSHPMELISRVTSAGGTTIQGIRALEEGRLTATVMAAVEAAARKASEMEG
jgi:pyrroline-5-carboxylate reductase